MEKPSKACEGTPESLRRLLPVWDRLYPEIQRGLVGAERLYSAHRDDEAVPRFMLAAPYILLLEREMIQFYKHKFPKWLRRFRPGQSPESVSTNETELRELVQGSERISLGHLVGWMSRLERAMDDQLLLELRSFSEALDPSRVLLGRASLHVLSSEVLPCRKCCVHIGRFETWLDTERLNRIREIVLVNFPGLGKGFLPAFIECEANILEVLGPGR